ncbi:MAG: LysM peptidoglycan-binding domain-containing protein [Planctomycetes bacterium]|jgi:nucleoid-associated protein YgaU|nr:LysM peptidoglycan-binding domain-containing protein [Planctomycetota bacterium]
MTSDAKIGLLLGLIFIFVIAFVINGLPPMGKAKVPALAGEELGASGVTGQAERAFDWPAPVDRQEAEVPVAQAASEATRPAVPEPAPATAAETTDDSLRYLLPLPRFEGLIERLTPTVSRDRVEVGGLDVSQPAPEPADTGSRPPVVTAPQPRPVPGLEPRTEPRVEPRPADATQGANAVLPPKPPAPVSKPATVPGGKLYVVVDGDNLAVIAKKMYGPEEGNRFVNIDRIVQANQAILQDPSQVHIGQKLVIPPLPKTPTAAAVPPAPRTPKPEEALPKDLFEKPKTTIAEKMDALEALGRRAAANLPAPATEGRWYTVQNGDSLWKIASSQLGSGARCEEIAKLNAGILPSPEALDVGMRLRLPTK